MAFHTSADIQNGEYGKWEYNSTTNTSKFVPLGKAVTIMSIIENIETDEAFLLLSFDYLGTLKTIKIPRKALSDPSLLQDLMAVGADVTKKNFNVFIDTLRQQELEIEATGQGSTKVYEHLGWRTIPVTTPSGNTARVLCYRANTMIGPYQASYGGSVKVTPMGTFEGWKEMVENEIIGHTPAEVVMLASLSAVVNGLISTHTTGENPIFHLNGLSGTGKTTLAMAGYSAYGEAFDGERRVYDQNGIPSRQTSGYSAWAATENATLGRCAGNQGWLVVLNELGKYKGGDMSSICYNASEGTDRARMTKDLKITQMEGFHTTILSVGEQSLLGRCKDKADGLRIRILELEDKLTKSADSSKKIKDAARKHNGHAAPMLAEHIINNGKIKMVLSIYDHWCNHLLGIWPDTPQKERFISKFPALLLTTADLAEQALGITFSKDAIIDWFFAREEVCGNDRNSAATSYEILLEEFRIHSTCFWRDNIGPASHNCWGKITTPNRKLPDGRTLVEEFLVRRQTVDELLAKHGFANKKTCIEAWQQAGVLSCDADRPTRSRHIEPGSKKPEDVYVFQVFDGIAAPVSPIYEQLTTKEVTHREDAHTA